MRGGVTGTAPDRVYVVEYSNVEHLCSDVASTFQIQLFENGGTGEKVRIVILSQGETDYTSGIEDASGTDALQRVCDNGSGASCTEYAQPQDVSAQVDAVEAKLDVIGPNVDATISSRATQISVDAVEAKADVLETKADVMESKLDVIQTAAVADPVYDWEAELCQNRCTIKMWLPAAQGGDLEAIRDWVDAQLNAVDASGDPGKGPFTAYSRTLWNQGVNHMLAGRYSNACAYFAAAAKRVCVP